MTRLSKNSANILLFYIILLKISFGNCNQPPIIIAEGNPILKFNLNPDFRFILPGTKWCGPGNISTNESEFGELIDLDKCCKNHDECEEIILAGKSNFGLTNKSPFTKLHCDCDNTFLRCLQQIQDKNRLIAGLVEFVYIQGNEKCFKKSKPIVCESMIKINQRCRKYSTQNGEERTQWFDLISLKVQNE
ncbi:phospholipase A2-like [Onthophagus taurus]|uniref:phospholipase A2-like n=1 Tax=Onthophagus taurus TaxID=166361 RepID=UPI0039BE80F3